MGDIGSGAPRPASTVAAFEEAFVSLRKHHRYVSKSAIVGAALEVALEEHKKNPEQSALARQVSQPPALPHSHRIKPAPHPPRISVVILGTCAESSFFLIIGPVRISRFPIASPTAQAAGPAGVGRAGILPAANECRLSRRALWCGGRRASWVSPDHDSINLILRRLASAPHERAH